MKIAAALLVTSLLGIPIGALAQSQPVLRGYAVLGMDLVRIGPSVSVQGGSVGATTGTVRVATAAQVSGAVVGGSVRVARRVRVVAPTDPGCTLTDGPMRTRSMPRTA